MHKKIVATPMGLVLHSSKTLAQMQCREPTMFAGLSTLRKDEKKSAVQTEEAKKLQAYLAKYAGGGEDEPFFLHKILMLQILH